MRFNRLRLESFVKSLYPYHAVKDGALFAFQRGTLTYTEYCVIAGIDDDNIYEE